ncbi:hypothetical protein LCM17_13015 [Cereibacter sphaeroides]|nr:hypothetical protein [Cereibacter sphaeroides]
MPSLTVTLDRAAGAAELRKGAWVTRIPIADLPGWRDFYRRLWRRGAKTKTGPGPWARFYDDDLTALEDALSAASVPAEESDR